MDISKDQFNEWRQNEVTEAFFNKLFEEREDMKEGLVSGSFENEEEVKGRCRCIGNLLAMTYSDLFANGVFEYTPAVEEFND